MTSVNRTRASPISFYNILAINNTDNVSIHALGKFQQPVQLSSKHSLLLPFKGTKLRSTRRTASCCR